MKRNFYKFLLLSLTLLLSLASMQAQTVGGAVYGGGRKANVTGTATVTVTSTAAYDATNHQAAIANVFGGNDITGNVGGAITINLNGGSVGNVFGGGNGAYGCNNGSAYTGNFQAITSASNPLYDADSVVRGLDLPVVNHGTTIIVKGTADDDHEGTGLNVSGAIYGGGNMAPIGTSTTASSTKIYLVSGTVHDVYGGGRMAPVYTNGGRVIEFTLANNTYPENVRQNSTVHVNGSIYAGNDIANLSTINTNYEGSVYVQGNPVISGSVFGGGNGDYDYTSHTGEVWSNTTPSVFVSKICSGYEAPKVKKGYVEVNLLADGSISGDVFGGGNAAEVTDEAKVKVLAGNLSDGRVFGGGNKADVANSVVEIVGGTTGTAFAGGNSATATTSATITVNEADNATATVGTVFGGNNQAEMAILPNIALTKGYVGDVYGGGNAGDMTAQVALSTKMDADTRAALGVADDATISTYVNINNTNINITGNVYGGCKAANVGSTTASASYVNAQAGTVHAIFGGNDVAGRCANTYVTVNGTATVTNIYGGANGMYDYVGTNVYEYGHGEDATALYTSTSNVARPTTDETHVYIHGGIIPENGAVYGGGLAGNCDNTNLLVDGEAVINGSLFGAGCGVQSDACQAHLGNVTTLAKTDIKSMSDQSTVSTVYGGGNAGDVARTELTIYNTCGGQFNTVYGGCRAANISGTAQTIIGQSNDGDTKLNIATLYGGNDYAGWVNKVDLQLLDGTINTVFGAGNGDYPYTNVCDKVPYNNDIHITVADPACKGNSKLHITDNLYGGGNMGVVGFDYDGDGSIAQTTGDINYTGRAQYGNCFTGRATSVGEYGQIVIDVYGGTIDGNLFGGASGAKFDANDETNKSSIYGNTKKTLVYALKQVNFYNGEVLHSIYGGSEAANDGYPFEIAGNETTPGRPSSIMNLVGGTITKNVYGAGFYGNVYGSVYVNVGMHAIDSCVAYLNPSETSYNTRSYNNGNNPYYVGMKPNYTAPYANYVNGVDFRDLYLLAAIYNGSDWGEAGANTVFTTRNFFGGESRIVVDGELYNTSNIAGSTLPVLRIENSIYGSGTSCEGGDIYRHITVRNYGDYTGCETRRELYSIQRADTVIFQNVGLALLGEQDAYSSYPSADFSINKIDKVVILRGHNVLAIEAPIVEIGRLESQNNDFSIAEYSTDLLLQNGCDQTLCNRYLPGMMDKNYIILRNGTYISVSRDGQYNDVNGFMYIDAEDETQGYVFASPWASEAVPADGGFVKACVSDLTNQATIDQLGYTNVGETYRTWEVGACGGKRTRKAAIVANTGVLKVNDNARVSTPLIRVPTQVEGETADKEFAVAHATLELPATDEGTFYTFNSVKISNAANGGQVKLVNAGWLGQFGTNAAGNITATGDFIALGGNAVVDGLREIAGNPNYRFGLSFVTRNNFNTTAGTNETQQGLLMGSENFSSLTGINQTVPVVSGAQAVIPTMDFFLLYDPTLDASLLRDVTFTFTEHRPMQNEDGTTSYCQAAVDVTLALATIVTEFEDFEVDVMAMYNGGISNEYVGKVTLPATFQRRELKLKKIEWQCDATADINCCFGDDNLFHLVDMESARGDNQEISVNKNITNFALKMGVTQNTGGATSSILGWYDIPNNMRDADVYTLISGIPTPTGHATRIATTQEGGYSIVNETDQISVGTLDGRSTAGIDFRLQFDGTIFYQRHFEADKDEPDHVGKVKLTFGYKTKKADQNGNMGTTDSDEEFTITVNVKTRDKADTIYVASATSLYRGGKNLSALDNTVDYTWNTSVTHDNPGKTPEQYLCHWQENIDKVYLEGDVIAVLDPVHFSHHEETITTTANGGTTTSTVNVADDVSVGPGSPNPMQIIRYSGTHAQFPGEACANKDALFIVEENATLDLRNLIINGSGLTRTKDNSAAEPNKLILKSHAPMFVVKDGATLNLNTNVTMKNNINKGGTYTVEGQQVHYPHGGAIALYPSETQTPTVNVGEMTNIYENVVFTDDALNSGAGIYVNNGNLNLGGRYKYPEAPVIKIDDNYAMAESHFVVKATRTSITDPIGWETINTGASCPLTNANCTPEGVTVGTTSFEEYVLDKDALKNCSTKHQNNVFLNREALAGQTTYADRLDSKNPPIYLTAQLGNDSRIGVTKWFEDGQEPSAWDRDTISIVRTTDDRYASLALGADIFFADNAQGERTIFYNNIFNRYEIYFQHCATFGQRTGNGFYGLEETTPYVMVAGATKPVDYHYVEAARCASPLENVNIKLQGGFYPYTYTWTGKTWNTEEEFTTIRDVTSEYGSEYSANKGEYLPIRAIASADTMALHEVQLTPGENEKAYIYQVNAHDLAGCRTNATIYVKQIRTGNTASWTPMTDVTLTTPQTDEPKMLASNENTATSTYAYLRQVEGTDVNFEVAPSWAYGNIVVGANIDQIGQIGSNTTWTLDSTTYTATDQVTFESPIFTVKKVFCPGDELVLTTNSTNMGSYVMWDFNPNAPQANALYLVPEAENVTIKAIYAPSDYWYQVVTSQPETFEVDYEGNVTIQDKDALAWLISTTNGLNNHVADQYHFRTVTVKNFNATTSEEDADEEAEPAAAPECIYDMSAHRWTPLGNINNPFSGTFICEEGVVIKGIYCAEENIPFVGFFGNLDGATIQNVNLEANVISGANYVGGISGVATNKTQITQCNVSNISAFSSDLAVGGLVGLLVGDPVTTEGNNAKDGDDNDGDEDEEVVVNGNVLQHNDVKVDLLGTMVSAGGFIGTEQGTNTISNNNAEVNTTKLVAANYIGGVVGQGESTSKNAPKTNLTKSLIANNYIHLITNANGKRVGGLVGKANNVNLVNNYVYGEIQGTQRVGGIIAQMGNNVNVDRCFYEEGCTDQAFGEMAKRGAKSVSNITTFSGQGNQVNVEESVGGITNVTRILNKWVREQGEGFNTWRSDLKFENHGYPIFGEPDMIPVIDTTVENVCDQFVFDGNTYTTSAIFTINVIDSVEMIDSTMYFVYNVGYSDYQEYTDEAEASEGYNGYGFSLTADELEEMMDGATDVRTFILVDSMLTEHGCDSVITLTLTVYPKQGVDEVDAELFEVSVYPNPTRGNVTVEAKEMTLIEVYDNASRRVMTLQVKGDKEQLNLSTLATGTYYLRVTTEHGTAVKKVVKK